MKPQKFALLLFMGFCCRNDLIFPQTNFWQPTKFVHKYRVETLASGANNHIFAGTIGGGIFRSIDHGENWAPSDSVLKNASVLSLAINAKGDIFAATGLGVFRSKNNGASWDSVYAPSNGIWRLAINSRNLVFGGGFEFHVARSLDNGDSWQRVGFPDRFLWSLAVSPNGHLFAGTNCCMLAGIRTGSLYISTNNAESWQKVYEENSPAFGYTGVDYVAVNDSGHIFAATSAGGIIRSTDDGKSWKKFDVYQPKISISCLTFNLNGHVFAGTYRSGVFRSTDNGEAWERLITGLPIVELRCIVVSPDGYVFVGTDGMGIFRSVKPTTVVKESTFEQPTSFYLKQNYPNPFNPSTTIQFALPRSGYVTLKIFNAPGEEMTTLVAKTLSAGKHQVVWEAKGMTSGIYFYRLQAADFVQTRKLVLAR